MTCCSTSEAGFAGGHDRYLGLTDGLDHLFYEGDDRGVGDLGELQRLEHKGLGRLRWRRLQP